MNFIKAFSSCCPFLFPAQMDNTDDFYYEEKALQNEIETIVNLMQPRPCPLVEDDFDAIGQSNGGTDNEELCVAKEPLAHIPISEFSVEEVVNSAIKIHKKSNQN